MLQTAITCKACSTLCVVKRQAGTVVSSRDHPLIAAVATFVGPADREVLVPKVLHENWRQEQARWSVLAAARAVYALPVVPAITTGLDYVCMCV